MTWLPSTAASVDGLQQHLERHLVSDISVLKHAAFGNCCTWQLLGHGYA